jgi:hypothetical protein
MFAKNNIVKFTLILSFSRQSGIKDYILLQSGLVQNCSQTIHKRLIVKRVKNECVGIKGRLLYSFYKLS